MKKGAVQTTEKLVEIMLFYEETVAQEEECRKNDPDLFVALCGQHNIIYLQ